MICVFDIESVPDVDLLREIYGYEGSDLEVCNLAFKAQREVSGSDFLPLSFHKITSIASVLADEFGNFIKVGNFAKNIDFKNREEALLDEFSKFLNKRNPKLISFNGRGYDMPLICLRALKYNTNLYSYYEVVNKECGKDKWENYRQRYSERFHLDLFDVLGNYGANRSLNLDSVCKMSGIMGKFEVDGSQVYELIFKDNDLAKVDFYCQSDVLNTYWLFLKFELTRSMINIDDYVTNLERMKDNLPQNAPYKEKFIQTIETEIAKVANN